MNLTEARVKFNSIKLSETARLREKYKQDLQNAIADAKLEMAMVAKALYDSGVSVSELCRQYGTLDRKTVTDLIKLAPATSDTELENPVVTHNADGTVTVSVVNFPPDKWTKKRAKLQAPATPYTGSVTWRDGLPDDPSSPVAHEWPQ